MSRVSLVKCCAIGKRVLEEAWRGEPPSEHEARRLGERVTEIVVDVLDEEDRWIDHAS